MRPTLHLTILCIYWTHFLYSSLLLSVNLLIWSFLHFVLYDIEVWFWNKLNHIWCKWNLVYSQNWVLSLLLDCFAIHIFACEKCMNFIHTTLDSFWDVLEWLLLHKIVQVVNHSSSLVTTADDNACKKQFTKSSPIMERNADWHAFYGESFIV